MQNCITFKQSIDGIGPARCSKKGILQLSIVSAIISVFVVCSASPGNSQSLSVDEISSMVDSRLATVNPYEELLNDPDPLRSFAALEIMMDSQDEELAGMAIRFGIASERSELRKLAAVSAYEHWNDLSRLNLDIQSLAATVETLTAAGEFEEAIEIAEAAIQDSQVGSQDINAVKLNNNLAFLYAKTGRLDEAKSIYVSSLSVAQAGFGNKHPQTITAQNNLAVLFVQAGSLYDAEQLFKASLASQSEILGEDHPDTIVSIDNLAGLYLAQGRYNEAISMYTQALESSERIFGPNHPETVLIRNKIEEAMLSASGNAGEDQ